ncbi:DUF397 domain-containing protein [Nocardiopsis changdeensis]|uniref:DUF397 domain-containing protein n=1 Tax=Nocardiopsis changdeensis TaxID=2831969 RepID=UPI003F476815
MGSVPRPIAHSNEGVTKSDGRLTGSWTKASYSGSAGACVEAAHLAPSQVGLRDSKHPTDTALTLPVGEWALFIRTTS